MSRHFCKAVFSGCISWCNARYLPNIETYHFSERHCLGRALLRHRTYSSCDFFEDSYRLWIHTFVQKSDTILVKSYCCVNSLHIDAWVVLCIAFLFHLSVLLLCPEPFLAISQSQQKPASHRFHLHSQGFRLPLCSCQRDTPYTSNQAANGSRKDRPNLLGHICSSRKVPFVAGRLPSD